MPAFANETIERLEMFGIRSDWSRPASTRLTALVDDVVEGRDPLAQRSPRRRAIRRCRRCVDGKRRQASSICADSELSVATDRDADASICAWPRWPAEIAPTRRASIRRTGPERVVLVVHCAANWLPGVELFAHREPRRRGRRRVFRAIRITALSRSLDPVSLSSTT